LRLLVCPLRHILHSNPVVLLQVRTRNDYFLRSPPLCSEGPRSPSRSVSIVSQPLPEQNTLRSAHSIARCFKSSAHGSPRRHLPPLSAPRRPLQKKTAEALLLFSSVPSLALAIPTVSTQGDASMHPISFSARSRRRSKIRQMQRSYEPAGCTTSFSLLFVNIFCGRQHPS